MRHPHCQSGSSISVPLKTSWRLCCVLLAEQGNLTHSQLRDAYEFSVFNGLCNLVVKTHPKLLSFSRNRHEKVREEFAKLDTEIMNLYRKRAAYRISRSVVPPGCG